jgi:Protein of unknown function (DUF3551)
MRAVPIVLIAAAGLLGAAVPASAETYDRPQERWCTVRNPGIGDIIWDCRYRTLAQCARVMGPTSDFCLQNPSWPPRRYTRR